MVVVEVDRASRKKIGRFNGRNDGRRQGQSRDLCADGIAELKNDNEEREPDEGRMCGAGSHD